MEENLPLCPTRSPRFPFRSHIKCNLWRCSLRLIIMCPGGGAAAASGGRAGGSAGAMGGAGHALMNQWDRFFREHGVNEFLLRRAQLKFGQVKTLQIAFRYFAPDPSPLYFDEKTGCVSIHMGMSIRPDPNDRGAAPTLDDLDHSALRLLANPDRVEMLRLMMNRPMGVRSCPNGYSSIPARFSGMSTVCTTPSSCCSSRRMGKTCIAPTCLP